MDRLSWLLVPALVATVVLSSPAASMEAAEGAIRGAITDTSGGALPGVTIVATAADGRVVATTVTDGRGAYEMSGLPPGAVRVAFQLDGFAATADAVAVRPDVVTVVDKRLELAAVSETVVVVGSATDVPRPSAQRPPPPAAAPVAAHDRDSVCGPAKAEPRPAALGTIRSRHETGRELYATDEELIIDGGTRHGLEAGQNLVARRYFRVTDADGAVVAAEHTAGVLQIVSAQERVSRAIVVYACDELMRGDFLAPFKPEPLRTAEPAGAPAYDAAARILFADAGHIVGASRRLMVIDRGSDHDLHVGQRITVFRRRRGFTIPSIIGDAVVVAIRRDSATIRVEDARDVIVAGDWAAPHRAAGAAAANRGAKFR